MRIGEGKLFVFLGAQNDPRLWIASLELKDIKNEKKKVVDLSNNRISPYGWQAHIYKGKIIPVEISKTYSCVFLPWTK